MIRMADILYRYADEKLALTMIESQELWFSDVRRMNDYGEYSAGFKIIEEIILSEYPDYGSVLEKVSPDGIGSRFKILICSFSKSDDCLSMWRGYGDNGRGISIGYDFNSLKLCSIGSRFLQKMAPISGKPMFIPVTYSKEEFLFNLRSNLNRCLSFGNQSPQDDGLQFKNIREGCVEKLLMRSCVLYKNEFFIDEREFRGFIEITPMDDPYDLAEIDSPFGRKEYSKLQTNKFSSCIREIVLGPCCSLPEEEMRGVLDENDLHSTVIRRSKGTYRI